MVSIPRSATVGDIWERVKEWPVEDRRSLATKIMQSLDRENPLPTLIAHPPKPAGSLADLIGAWADVDPKPTDEDVKRLIEESMMEKHG